ncbi:hypothetical protein Bca52824_002867 [Brassica carinata]|uniref:S-protein homolog n=1 Tax=Brassica carinata TaxID=52824 RepID=A0A8X8BE99_BRACI|nr:hypothetical protein Bca52824_002867 [Brassica carinata]
MDIPKQYLSLFILIIFVTTNLSHAESIVKIYNGLGSTMRFRCKSKDTDLGYQSVPPHAMWLFSFQRNFFGRSLYYCYFDLPNGRRWFDIYKEPRDTSDSDYWKNDCVWKITPSGPCKYNEYRTQTTLCFPWNKN